MNRCGEPPTVELPTMVKFVVVELIGIEPTTSGLQSQRSPN